MIWNQNKDTAEWFLFSLWSLLCWGNKTIGCRMSICSVKYNITMAIITMTINTYKGCFCISRKQKSWTASWMAICIVTSPWQPLLWLPVLTRADFVCLGSRRVELPAEWPSVELWRGWGRSWWGTQEGALAPTLGTPPLAQLKSGQKHQKYLMRLSEKILLCTLLWILWVLLNDFKISLQNKIAPKMATTKPIKH